MRKHAIASFHSRFDDVGEAEALLEVGVLGVLLRGALELLEGEVHAALAQVHDARREAGLGGGRALREGGRGQEGAEGKREEACGSWHLHLCHTEGDGASGAAAGAAGGGASPMSELRSKCLEATEARRALAGLTSPAQEAPLEGVDTGAVELLAREEPEPRDGRLEGHRLRVGPVGRHGVERVGDAHDAAEEGDLVALHALGVAAAVHVLVVHEPVARLLLEQRHRLEDVLPLGRVLLHDLVLLVGEGGGLAQDLVLDADLADVVDDPREVDALHLLRAHPEVLGDTGGVVGDALGVAAGVGVLLVDRVRQHADGAHEELLVLLGPPLDLLDRLLDLLPHLVEGVGEEADLVAAASPRPAWRSRRRRGGGRPRPASAPGG